MGTDWRSRPSITPSLPTIPDDSPPVTTVPTDSESIGRELTRIDSVRSIANGWIKLRGRSDNLPQRWWFASTAIPLVAATIGPLCNVLSIAALVSPWRLTLPNNGELPDGIDDAGVGIADPHWEIIWNAVSLTCGYAGNIFLLLNFTGRVRYIIALPLSILLWLMSSVILISITATMSIYAAPVGPAEVYSQGFWHAVMASILYFAGSVILCINLGGYLRGHYPQNFDLDDDQRTLILQTMMFFFWLAGGAGIFCAIEGWSYADALYYCDVSVLTIGFGDFYPLSSSGRGFLFCFELIGIIFLGLVISSISRFARNISADKIVKMHQRHSRETTVGRTVTSEQELRERLGLPPRRPSAANSGPARRESLQRYGSLKIVGRTVTFRENRGTARGGGRGGAGSSAVPSAAGMGSRGKPLSRDAKMQAHSAHANAHERRRQRRQKLLLLQEEKDRFEAMREIQEETRRFKQYWALAMAFLAFGILWCMGALVFMLSEARLLGLSYFQALYFCFVALLTIGYGDFSPKSNVGKPFFIVWSLIAVPIVTMLIQEMSSTVVSAINRGTFKLADWTVLPKKGILKGYLDDHPRVRDYLQQLVERRQQRERIRKGFQIQSPDDDVEAARAANGDDDEKEAPVITGAAAEKGRRGEEEQEQQDDDDGPSSRLERVAAEQPSEHDLARQLALAIKGVAQDLRADPPKRYSYEEWVHYTKLIRFSRQTREQVEQIEEEEGLVEWDWLGEDSPMLADITEAEWVLDRLCESLNRYTRRQQAHKPSISMVKRRKVRMATTDRDEAQQKQRGEKEEKTDSDDRNGCEPLDPLDPVPKPGLQPSAPRGQALPGPGSSASASSASSSSESRPPGE